MHYVALPERNRLHSNYLGAQQFCLLTALILCFSFSFNKTFCFVTPLYDKPPEWLFRNRPLKGAHGMSENEQEEC